MLFNNPQIDLSALPVSSEVQYEPLERKYLQVQFIGGMLTMMILMVVFTVALINTGYWEYPAWRWAAIVLWLLILIWQLIKIRKGFEKKSYALRQKDIIYRTGWIFKKSTIIPFSRVQHCDIKQGPVERMYDLARLNIYTAGGSTSDMTIPGLSPERAEQLKQYVSGKINMDESE